MIAGRYSLDEEIGRGGAGVVHLGTDQVLGRRVAIKRIGVVPGADTPDLQRAEREARLAAALNHPHVVAIFDLVEEEGSHWLVMEYVEGQTLAQLIRTTGPLEPTRAARILGQAADALVQAHRAGIVHRDVKPSNILVSAHDEAKLGDFGIARASGDVTLTQTGLVTGSPAYLAPEVASGSTASERSDVWSLGATMFHAVTGRPPYAIEGNLVGALYQIVHDEPPALPPDHPLAGLLAVAMVKEPSERWPMERVRHELHLLAQGEAGTAPPQHPLPTPPAGTSSPEPVTRIAPTPSKARASQPSSSPGRSALLLLAGGLLVVLAIAGWQASRDDRPTGSPDQPTATGTPQPETPDPSQESPDPEETREAMDVFIGSYLEQVTSDPEGAFGLLTPRFQESSGGLEGYLGWWGTVRSARLQDIDSNPEDLTVGYTVRYRMEDGSRTTEQIRLRLVRSGDTFLIDGEG